MFIHIFKYNVPACETKYFKFKFFNFKWWFGTDNVTIASIRYFRVKVISEVVLECLICSIM